MYLLAVQIAGWKIDIERCRVHCRGCKKSSNLTRNVQKDAAMFLGQRLPGHPRGRTNDLPSDFAAFTSHRSITAIPVMIPRLLSLTRRYGHRTSRGNGSSFNSEARSRDLVVGCEISQNCTATDFIFSISARRRLRCKVRCQVSVEGIVTNVSIQRWNAGSWQRKLALYFKIMDSERQAPLMPSFTFRPHPQLTGRGSCI